MKSRIDVMVDIESLSTKPGGAVIAIGLCAFDTEFIYDSTEILIDPRYTPGHRDQSTFEWWATQSIDTFEHAMSGKTKPWVAVHEMTDFIGLWSEPKLWANSPSFDINMLRELYRVYDVPFPIHFSDERDFRTLQKIAAEMGVDYREPLEARRKHDAKEDAVAQAEALQLIAKGLAVVL